MQAIQSMLTRWQISQYIKSTDIRNQNIFNSQEHTNGFIASKDGATVGYCQLAHDARIVLVQGTVGTAQYFVQLARSLADTVNVFFPNRRGRGMSRHVRSDYSIHTEVEDLDALLTKTNARYVFGLSSGAMIFLQAELTLPTIVCAQRRLTEVRNINEMPVSTD